jgi:hypothetical protein
MTKKHDTKEVFVAVKNLSVVWLQAQRPFQESWAKSIAENFDDDKFDPPVITRPNGEGKYHIVEGQHRVHAARILFGDNEQIKCRMVDADDPARAAEIFLGINSGRKAIKPVAKFGVSVTAKKEPHVSILALVLKMGYKIGSHKGDYCISAVNSLIYVHERQGMAMLEKTLKILDESWPGDHSAFQGDMLKGYAVFLNEYPHVNMRRLADVIVKIYGSPNRLMIAVKLYRDQGKVTLVEAMSEVLRSKYNYNMKSGTKLERK